MLWVFIELFTDSLATFIIIQYIYVTKKLK